MLVIHNHSMKFELIEFPPIQNYVPKDLHLDCLRAIIIKVDEVVLYTVQRQIIECIKC